MLWEVGIKADQTDTGWEQTKKYWDNNTETAYTMLGPQLDPCFGGKVLNGRERARERGRSRRNEIDWYRGDKMKRAKSQASCNQSPHPATALA